MRLRQIPAGRLSLMPTGRSQTLDTLLCHVCLSMCMCYCLESFMCTRVQTTRTLGCFSEHWPLFTSALPPSCSLFELQRSKGNNVKVIVHLHRCDADYKLANNKKTKDGFWLMCTIWRPIDFTQSIKESTAACCFPRCEIIDLALNIKGCWPSFCCRVHKHNELKSTQQYCTCM